VLFGNGLIPGFVLNLVLAYGVSRLTALRGAERGAAGNM